MTAKARAAFFQLFGGAVALAIAAAGILGAEAAYGSAGRFALVLSVPAGVIIGMVTVKLLHFAYNILVKDR